MICHLKEELKTQIKMNVGVYLFVKQYPKNLLQQASLYVSFPCLIFEYISYKFLQNILI